MSVPVVNLALSSREHIRAWHGVMDLAGALPEGSWTVVGGSMVYLHCAERDTAPTRETYDVDAMLNAQDYPDILMRFTTALKNVGFASAEGASMEGHHHRWLNGGAMVDVLIPRGLGARTASRKGADGGTTIQSPAGMQALRRSNPVDVIVGGREARIFRPNMLGAIVGKSAAYGITQDPKRERHLRDLATLLSIVVPSDDLSSITPRDRRYLNSASSALAPVLDSYGIPDADLGLERVREEVARSVEREALERVQSVKDKRRRRVDKSAKSMHCGVQTKYMHGPCLKPRGHDPREGHASV